MLEVGSVSFWSHIHSRGECCSELPCLRSEDLLTATSFITSELINPGVYCTGLFSSRQIALRYTCKNCKSLDFHLDCSFGNPCVSALSFDPTFKPFDGIWLAAFSPCMSVLIYATLWFSQKHHPQNLGLVSFQQYGPCLFCVSDLKLCLLKSVWTLLAFLTQIGTCKIDSRPKNGFLFTKNIDFKRISEGTNCSLDAQSSQGCKLWLIYLKLYEEECTVLVKLFWHVLKTTK